MVKCCILNCKNKSKHNLTVMVHGLVCEISVCMTHATIIQSNKYELNLVENVIEHIQDRPGHVKRHAVNCDKLLKTKQWKPEINFDDGIRQTIKWYKENPVWWKKLKYSKFT